VQIERSFRRNLTKRRPATMPHHIVGIIRDHLFTLPTLAKFALGMVLLVAVPRLCRRLQMPAVVGLLLGGVIIGPYVLGFFGTDRPIADFCRSSASCC
jgi:hypothetical protein